MWVFIERDGDSVLPVSLELCSETRRLCDASGEKLVAVIVGSISDGELQRVLDCGVDKIIHVTGTGYDYFNNDAYTNLFTVLCRKYRPTAVMVGGTINGRDFAPRFAARRHVEIFDLLRVEDLHHDDVLVSHAAVIEQVVLAAQRMAFVAQFIRFCCQ